MKKRRWGFIIVPRAAARFVVAEGKNFTEALAEASHAANHDHLFYKLPLVENMIHLTDFDRRVARRAPARFQTTVGVRYEADGHKTN